MALKWPGTTISDRGWPLDFSRRTHLRSHSESLVGLLCIWSWSVSEGGTMNRLVGGWGWSSVLCHLFPLHTSSSSLISGIQL